MNISKACFAAFTLFWFSAGTCAAGSPILGTVDISAISSKIGTPPVFLDLAFNPQLNVFYVSDSLGQPGGSIYTVDMRGNILHTLSIRDVIGDSLRMEAMAYDQSGSGHLFLLTYDFANCDPNGCSFEYFVFEISPDGSTLYLNAPLQGLQCGDRMTVTSQNLWVSCGSDYTIRQYTSTGALLKEVSVAALFTPPNVPFSLAPDFGGGLLVNDFNGQRVLDITTQGALLAAVSTKSLSSQIPVAMASDVTGGRIFLNMGGPTIYILSSQFLQSPATVNLSNTSWTFSAHAPGTVSGLGQIFVTNEGVTSLHISSAKLSGDAPDQFALTNNCPATLGIAHTCNLQFTFRPTKPGWFKALIQLNDDAPDAPQTVTLSGVGTGPVLLLSNYSWHFQSHPVGQASGTSKMYATNTGTAVLHFSSVGMSGTNAGDFPITGSTCGASLAPQVTCSVTFHFTPLAVGTRTASLVFQDDSVPDQQAMTLSGQGTNP